MKNKHTALFILIFLFSFFIRVFLLTQYPEGFDQTETAFGYNSYSLLKTGRDEDGKFLPLVLVSIGDYKLAGYSYWQIPFIAVFGLNEFSTRLSTVTASLFSLVLLYFIVYEWLKNRKLALLTVFFTGISPWHLVLSRMAYDPMIALMALLASIFFFTRWFKTNKLVLLLGSSLSLSGAVLTYYAVWVILPFILIFFWVYLYKKHGVGGNILLPLITTLIPLLVLTKLYTVTQGQRLGQDSTFQVNAYPLLQEQIREDQRQFPLLVTRVFHNKLLFYPQTLLQNFFSNLNFDFLFLRGDKFDRRFFVPYQGVLYLWTAPFILLGVLYFWKNHSFAKNTLMLGAIGIIFLGSAFSEFGSETERTLFAVPIFSFLASYGLLTVHQDTNRYKKWRIMPVSVLLALLLAFNVAYFNHQYYWHANVHEPWGRDYGMRDMVSTVLTLEKNYKTVVVPDSTYIFFYFFGQVNPAVAWEQSATRLDTTNYLGLKTRAKVGNFLTMPIECPGNGKLNVLYVCRGTKIPKMSKVIKVIRYRDEQPAFTLLEFIPTESKEPPPKNVSYLESSQILEGDSDRYW